MSNLKTLRTRIKSVQSTKKITAAMKMIAAAKLKKAQVKAVAARPYAQYIRQMVGHIARNYIPHTTLPCLLNGNGKDDRVMIIVATSNRGLCGGFNTSIVRQVRTLISQLKAQGKQFKLYCIGNKGYDQLRRQYADQIIGYSKDNLTLDFDASKLITDDLIQRYQQGEFDQCVLVFNQFISALKQEVISLQIIPAQLTPDANIEDNTHPNAVYDFEPDEEEILATLLPQYMATQLFSALLENEASEQGARMAAMEGATRNAQDMIRKLSLDYNRTRQSVITNELIEIIAGADAL